MLCPSCKTKKGKPVNVDPVSRVCQKCGKEVRVDHSGKRSMKGVPPTAASTAAPASAAVKK